MISILRPAALLTAIGLSMSLSAFAADTVEPDYIRDAKMHFSFAVQSKNNNNFEEAAKQYEKSISLYDSLYQVRYSYADMLLSEGKKEAARASFRRAYDLNPDYYNSAVMLSNLYYEAGKHDSVLVMFEAMYRLKPENIQLLVSIAGLKEYMGDREGALESYSRAIEAGETSFDVLMKAAELSLALDKSDTAMNYTEKALKLNADDVNALSIAAAISEKSGNDRAALDYNLRLLDIMPSVDGAVKTETLARKLNDTESLTCTLQCHHSLAAQDVTVIGELAELLYKGGKTEESVAYAKKGLEINPGDGRLRIIMGDYYLSKKQESKALEQFKLAMNDDRWKSSAQRLAWQIEKPETDEEKNERAFFNRGK